MSSLDEVKEKLVAMFEQAKQNEADAVREEAQGVYRYFQEFKRTSRELFKKVEAQKFALSLLFLLLFQATPFFCTLCLETSFRTRTTR